MIYIHTRSVDRGSYFQTIENGGSSFLIDIGSIVIPKIVPNESSCRMAMALREKAKMCSDGAQFFTLSLKHRIEIIFFSCVDCYAVLASGVRSLATSTEIQQATNVSFQFVKEQNTTEEDSWIEVSVN